MNEFENLENLGEHPIIARHRAQLQSTMDRHAHILGFTELEWRALMLKSKEWLDASVSSDREHIAQQIFQALILPKI